MKRVLLTLFASAAVIYACKNPVQDLDLGLKTALTTNVEIHFKFQPGDSPKSVAVRLTGPDADKVVSILNTKNFRVDGDGVLRLSTLASVAPQAGHPLHFTVVATAAGFVEMVQPIALSDNNQRMLPITMLLKQSGSLLLEAAAQSDADGSLKNTLTLRTPAAGSTAAQASVTIQQGTLLKDASDQPIDGNLVVRVQPVLAHSAQDLPRGGVLSNATTTTGEATGGQQLTQVAGAVTLNIHNQDYRTVKSFSKPIQLAFVVDAQTIDPATNLPIKAGDAIPMFSYDAATDRWQEEASGRIEKNNRTGQLECIANPTHLSTWAAAYSKSVCSEGVQFEVESNFENYDVPFYCQVVYVDKKGRDLSVASSFYRELLDGSDISVTNLNRNAFVRLKVYENPADLSRFIASSVVKSCGDGEAEIDVRALKVPSAAVAMTFTIQFPCKKVNKKNLPKNVVAQYRQSGSTPWLDLVSLETKDIKKDLLQGTTYKVTKGKRYDLRVKVLGFNFEQPNQLIDKTDWLVKIRGHEFCEK